jgi:bifunctional ADP-heptose synthase (sugar kinase/adenylyltransferase)
VNENLIPAWIRAHSKVRVPDDLLVHAVLANADVHETTGTTPEPEKRPRYGVAAIGGTFDHLHAGHKVLLSMAAWVTEEKLIVGVTGASTKSFAESTYGRAVGVALNRLGGSLSLITRRDR